MAYLGKTFIAGYESYDGMYKCGISYSLANVSPVSHTFSLRGGRWQVEFLTSSKRVVARTFNAISFKELHSVGFSVVQEALDLLSVQGLFSTNLGEPENSSIGVYQEHGRSILFVYELCDFPMSVHCEVIQMDSHGNTIEPLPAMPPVWNESFRYFRLSQSSNDLFEAYRNLFLAFEALLNFICEKKQREGERAWLNRALSSVSSVTSLAHLVPKGEGDPVTFIINSQYQAVRCKLQHAKFPNAQLPHASISPLDVKQAYNELVRIWKHIASVYLHVGGSGGVVTYAGFSMMMNNCFGEEVKVHFTADNTPVLVEDIAISPQGMVAHEFEQSHYLGEVAPGVVRILANETVTPTSHKYALPIHRIGLSAMNALISIGRAENGITISGVDEWEYINDFRLINATQPKTSFNT